MNGAHPTRPKGGQTDDHTTDRPLRSYQYGENGEQFAISEYESTTAWITAATADLVDLREVR